MEIDVKLSIKKLSGLSRHKMNIKQIYGLGWARCFNDDRKVANNRTARP